MRKDFGKIDVIRYWEAQRDGFPHIHCILIFHNAEFETYFHKGKRGSRWLVSKKRELEKYWAWGFTDMWAMYSIGAGIGYVLKYVTKVNDSLIVENPKRNDVLSLALMWIFKKRAFSVSKDFGEFLVEEKDDSPYGQVDFNGDSIYQWYLVGFWADLNGEYGSWSVDLSYNGFWRIRSSKKFSCKAALLD